MGQNFFSDFFESHSDFLSFSKNAGRFRDTQSFDRIGAATTRRYGIVVFRSPLRRSSIRSKVRIKATSADTKGRVRGITEYHENATASGSAAICEEKDGRVEWCLVLGALCGAANAVLNREAYNGAAAKCEVVNTGWPEGLSESPEARRCLQPSGEILGIGQRLPNMAVR